MRCSFCGYETEDGRKIKYCPNCGASMEQEPEQTASEKPDSETQEPDKEEQKGNPENQTRYEDPNAGYTAYGYTDCRSEESRNAYDPRQSPDEQNEYSYGKSSDGQNKYGYSQSSDGQNEYGYSQSPDGQNEYSYGQPYAGNRPNEQQYYREPKKQLSSTPYMIFSILVTLCCCLPFGIVSIVYASRISSLQKMGDYVGAEKAAKKAKTFMIIGAVGGLVSSLILGATGVFSTVLDLEQNDDVREAILDEYGDDENEDAAETDDGDEADEEDKNNAEESGADDSQETAQPAEEGAELGERWDSYAVQINDTVLTFPCSISDVEALGLTMDTDMTPKGDRISPDDYELVFFDLLDDGESICSMMFVVSNNTDEEQAVKDCVVDGIRADEYSIEDGGLTIIFPGDIRIGSDISTAIEKWGEPSDVYDGDYTKSYAWYSADSDNYCVLDTDPETGKITCVDLDAQDQTGTAN